MPIYTVRNLTTGAAAPKTHITITAPANGRVKLRGLLFKTGTTNAASYEWEIQRLSVNATGSAQTPNPTNPDDIASRTTALSAITAEGTSSASLWEIGANVLGSFSLWVPLDKLAELVNSGILAFVKTVGTLTSQIHTTLFFEE